MPHTNPPSEHKIKAAVLLNRSQTIKSLGELPQEHPDIAWFNLLNRRIYILHKPEYIKQVLQENYQMYHKGLAYDTLKLLLGNGLITSEGDFWKRQRRLVAPAFHRDKIKGLMQLFHDLTMEQLQKWENQIGKTIDFTREMAQLTINIVCRAMFGTAISDEQIATVYNNVNKLNEMAIKRINSVIKLPKWLPTPQMLQMRYYIRTLDAIVYGIIRQRMASPTQDNDLLNMLLNARDEETGESMSALQLRDELMTIFLAGHETTVNTLSWTWFLLHQHPDAAQCLADEYQQIAPPSTMLQPEHIPQLKYATNVIYETLRLYPAAYLISRESQTVDTMGGFDIPRGTNCLVNIYGLHRHPKYWEKPHDFMPDRFNTFDQKGDNRFVFLPFGGGPRICVGNNFALTEMLVINRLIAQHVSMELVTQQPEPLPQVTLKPRDGIHFRITGIKL
ncbi:MAG: cytochrome P450 [Chitinophagales bacterium]|jgi:cytochrome P450|nr:cytochrome P450 [Chitinophagales bacterium]